MFSASVLHMSENRGREIIIWSCNEMYCVFDVFIGFYSNIFRLGRISSTFRIFHRIATNTTHFDDSNWSSTFVSYTERGQSEERGKRERREEREERERRRERRGERRERREPGVRGQLRVERGGGRGESQEWGDRVEREDRGERGEVLRKRCGVFLGGAEFTRVRR